MATFNQRMKELRAEENITLEELAKALSTTKSTLSRYENNLRTPNADFINQLAKYFNVSVDYLLGNSNDKNIDESKISEIDKKLIDDITSLDDDLKKEAEKYIELLKIKQNLDKNKDEQSATLDQDIC
ncbi:MAG TPA: XRE family transcriptional regulator [Clostridium sp.]|jgi:transcriptional regulator with XRE-family HTH domain|nr:XRE family transcriptional regulator [Clostridium sp.]